MTIQRGLLILGVGGGLVLFTVQNLSPAVPLAFFGMRTQAIPLSVWVLGAIAAGALTTLAIGGVGRLPGASGPRRRSARASRGSRFSAQSSDPDPVDRGAASYSAASYSSGEYQPPPQDSSDNFAASGEPADRGTYGTDEANGTYGGFEDWGQPKRTIDNWDDWAAYQDSRSAQSSGGYQTGDSRQYSNQSDDLDFERPEYWEGVDGGQIGPRPDYSAEYSTGYSDYPTPDVANAGYSDPYSASPYPPQDNYQGDYDRRDYDRRNDDQPSGYDSSYDGDDNGGSASGLSPERPVSLREQLSQRLENQRPGKLAAGETQPVYDADYRVIVPPPPGTSEEDEDWGLDDWGLDNTDRADTDDNGQGSKQDW